MSTVTVRTLRSKLYPSSVSQVQKPRLNSYSVSVLYIFFITLRFNSSAQPESVTIHPVNATAVRISWSGSPYFSTSLQYTSYFTATGSVMSQYETVLAPDVTSTDITLDDAVDGYGHNFTLQYIITCDLITGPVTTATFTFGKQEVY